MKYCQQNYENHISSIGVCVSQELFMFQIIFWKKLKLKSKKKEQKQNKPTLLFSCISNSFELTGNIGILFNCFFSVLHDMMKRTVSSWWLNKCRNKGRTFSGARQQKLIRSLNTAYEWHGYFLVSLWISKLNCCYWKAKQKISEMGLIIKSEL